MSEFSKMPEKWAEEQAKSEAEAFERALKKTTLKEPFTSKDQECSRCCHRLVCIMYSTHKAENYEGCDFFMPFIKPAIPLTTYNTETEYRNAWNEVVATQAQIRRSIQKAAEAELDTLTHTSSGLLD